MIGRLFTRIGDTLVLFHSAAAAAEAVENGRRPAARDLRVLGIPANAFARIGHG